MHSINNEKGAVLVFMTLMIVLLMVMVGMGLDTGQLAYTRSQGQAAVDAAALSALSGLPVGDLEVKARAAEFNSKNDYLNSPNNPIKATNITYVNYDASTGAITTLPSITGANGVRVALETTNPYTTVAAGSAMQSPLFLTPIMRLFGQSAPSKMDVSVSAVAAIRARPSLPVAVYQSMCGTTGVQQLLTAPSNGADNSCWTTYWTPPVSDPTVEDKFTNSKTCSGLGGLGNGPIGLGNGVTTPVYAAAKDLFKADWSKCWIVPVVPDGSSCNRTDDIKDWAKICPTEVVFPGNGGGGTCPSGSNGAKCILGTITCGQSLYRTTDSLCFSSRLVREPKSASCPGCSM